MMTFPIYGKIRFMFQTTNQDGMGVEKNVILGQIMDFDENDGDFDENPFYRKYIWFGTCYDFFWGLMYVFGFFHGFV